MRLLCDEMLKRVGRWLRAAGYDVAIVEDGARDDDLLKRATAEHRLLLTCDRRLAGRAAPDATVIVLRTERFEGAARELRERLGIDWLHAPFTRCLLDNAPLVPAHQDTLAGLPATVRQGDGPIMRCAVRSGVLAGQPRAPDAGEAHSRAGQAAAGLSFAAAAELPLPGMIRFGAAPVLETSAQRAARRPVEPLVTSDIPGSRVRVGGRRVLQVRGSSGAAADGAGR
jgi:uncharacterized protein